MRKSATALVVISAVMLALTGCSTTSSWLSVPTSAATPTAASTQPTPSRAPDEYWPNDVLTRTPLPPRLEKYRDMAPEDFARLPKREQWIYVSWLTQYRTAFAETFSLVSGDPLHAPAPLTAASSYGKQLQFNNYTLRMATYQTKAVAVPRRDGTCGPLDVDASTKIHIAAELDPQTAMKYAAQSTRFSGGQAICPSEQAASGAFDTARWTIAGADSRTEKVDGEDVDVVTIRYTTSAGIKNSIDVYRMMITTYNGESQAIAFVKAPTLG